MSALGREQNRTEQTKHKLAYLHLQNFLQVTIRHFASMDMAKNSQPK
jgi:hypothetical protein